MLGGGSPAASLCWHCLGEEMPLVKWKIVYQYRRRNGAASQLLIEVLGKLSDFGIPTSQKNGFLNSASPPPIASGEPGAG
jgi:hypothetical protein